MASKNLIFLHLPKNGGTTLHTILDRNYSKKNTYTIQLVDNKRLSIPEFKAMPDNERKKIHLLKGHLRYGLHEYLYGESEYITFLRKPEERIISFYNYVKNNSWHRLYKRVKDDNLSLYDFAQNITDADINNAQIRFISGINDTEDNMLNKALENIEKHFSFVGLLEHFDESLILLKKHYSWKTPYYKIENQSKKKVQKDNIDSKTVSLIKNLNNGDCKLYSIIEEEFLTKCSAVKDMPQKLRKLRRINTMYSTLYNQAKRIYKAGTSS